MHTDTLSTRYCHAPCRYCWLQYPGTPHYVLSLFTPSGERQPKWSGGGATNKWFAPRAAPKGDQWCIWLVGLEQLRPAAAAAGQQTERAAGDNAAAAAGAAGGDTPAGAAAGSSGNVTAAAMGPSMPSTPSAPSGRQLYLTFVMKKAEGKGEGTEATWQLAGPDADKRGRQPPPKPLPLDVS